MAAATESLHIAEPYPPLGQQSGIHRVPCLAGESQYCPQRMVVAAWFGAPRRVEQLCDGEVWEGIVRRGHVHVIAPGHETRFRKKRDGEYACLFIEPEWLAPLAAEPGALRSHALVVDSALAHVLSALSADLSPDAASLLFRQAAAQAVVARLLAIATRRTPSPARAIDPNTLAGVVDYMHAHVHSDVSVSSLAALAGRSEAQFARDFRHTTGEPPHRIQQQLRRERARAEIATLESGLTRAERNVLSYLHLGYTNADIAMACELSPNTVRNQLHRAFAKLGVASRAEAVALLAAGTHAG